MVDVTNRNFLRIISVLAVVFLPQIVTRVAAGKSRSDLTPTPDALRNQIRVQVSIDRRIRSSCPDQHPFIDAKTESGKTDSGASTSAASDPATKVVARIYPSPQTTVEVPDNGTAPLNEKLVLDMTFSGLVRGRRSLVAGACRDLMDAGLVLIKFVGRAKRVPDALTSTAVDGIGEAPQARRVRAPVTQQPDNLPHENQVAESKTADRAGQPQLQEQKQERLEAQPLTQQKNQGYDAVNVNRRVTTLDGSWTLGGAACLRAAAVLTWHPVYGSPEADGMLCLGDGSSQPRSACRFSPNRPPDVFPSVIQPAKCKHGGTRWCARCFRWQMVFQMAPRSRRCLLCDSRDATLPGSGQNMGVGGLRRAGRGKFWATRQVSNPSLRRCDRGSIWRWV